jgi:3-oxoacid CoA-transferase A subunit
MKTKLLDSFDAAVADMVDGASIMIGGFAGVGTPFNLLRAVYDRGVRDLTIIANSPNVAREDMVAIANLIEAKRARKVMLAFTAATHPSRRSLLEVMDEAGEIEAELIPQGTLAERIRAGGAGIPAFYTPAAVGTELAEGKEHREFDGRTYILERALRADYALVRAWKGDAFGNLVYKGSQRNFNPIMAMAAACTIAEVEEVLPIGSFEPEQVHTSGIFVDRLACIPEGGVLHQPRGGGA